MIRLVFIRLPGEISDPLLDAASALLTRTERERMARFKEERHRREFAARRFSRRILIARELGVAPSSIGIDEGDGKKPRLVGHELRFNCSNSGDLLCFAFSSEPGIELGVDIERRREFAEWPTLVRLHMPELLRGNAPKLPDFALFLKTWTKKEAYLKAIGLGLSVEPSEIDLGEGDFHLTDANASKTPYAVEVVRNDRDCVASLAYSGPRVDTTSTDLDFETLIHAAAPHLGELRA